HGHELTVALSGIGTLVPRDPPYRKGNARENVLAEFSRWRGMDLRRLIG
ncbi:hypothetical protein TNCV_4084081, partial [Trichonephila clavipes]